MQFDIKEVVCAVVNNLSDDVLSLRVYCWHRVPINESTVAWGCRCVMLALYFCSFPRIGVFLFLRLKKVALFSSLLCLTWSINILEKSVLSTSFCAAVTRTLIIKQTFQSTYLFWLISCSLFINHAVYLYTQDVIGLKRFKNSPPDF